MGMITATAASAIWNEIELAESCLVCSMFEEAASLASSILERLLDHGRGLTTEEEAAQVYDMLESTGMVLVQSLKEIGRTSEILNQLRLYFASVKIIPAQVLLAGACFQIADGSPFTVREFLKDFLNGWILRDEQYYTFIAESNLECGSGYNVQFVLEIDKYMEIVEVYVVTLLATVLKDVDLAISWVENASLPEEKQQGLLRRLHSMHSIKSTNWSQSSLSHLPGNNNEASFLPELHTSQGLPKALKSDLDNKKFRSKEVILKLSERIEPYFWCFRAVNLKFGTAQFVISSGKMMLGCLILFLYYVYQKKQASIKRTVRRKVIAVTRALVDLWQLAFSYQVNPLAAVQPLPAATRKFSGGNFKLRLSCNHLHLGHLLLSAMENRQQNQDYVHYNHTDPCRYARWTTRESYQFMYARPWQLVNDFYLHVVQGNLSLPVLFGAEVVV